jgi:tRNA A-37 threonylcarbamoyl transferase component Bud32
VQLEHFFEPIARPAERLRCLQRLGETLGRVIDPRQVCRATHAYRRVFYRHRDRRTRRESKYFERVSAGGWHGWADADWADAVAQLLAQLGQAPHEAMPAPPLPGAAAIKEGETSSVWRVPAGDGRTLILKRHNKAGRQAGLRGLGRASRSLAAFRKGHALLARGIVTARPAAAADLRQAGVLRETVLLTEAVDGERLSDWLRGNPAPAERRRMTRLLALMLRRMHDAGFSHRDLKAPNILVPRVPGGLPVLVDLDGLRQSLHVTDTRRAQNLMRLSVSLDEWGLARRTDRLRFLRAYLGRRGGFGPITIRSRRRGSAGPAAHLRRWWRQIARLSARKMKALQRKRA